MMKQENWPPIDRRDIFNKLNIQGRIDHQTREVLFEKAPFLIRIENDEYIVKIGKPRDIWENDPLKDYWLRNGFYVIMEGSEAGGLISINIDRVKVTFKVL